MFWCKLSVKLSRNIILFFLILCNSSFAQVIENSTDVGISDDRYRVHGNGTVTDLKTGLMWAQCSLGQIWDQSTNTCLGNELGFNWNSAQSFAQNVVLANYSDWRIPNLKELASIVALDRYDPAINLYAFPSTRSNIAFWTSTPDRSDATKAYIFGTYYGFQEVTIKTTPYAIRLVRGSY